MALRKIQDLSSYSLTAVDNNQLFIPATTQVTVSGYKVVKIRPEQIYNYVINQLAVEDNIYITGVTIPTISSTQLTSVNLYVENINSTNNTILNTLSSTSISSTEGRILTLNALDISATSFSARSVNASDGIISNITASNISISSIATDFVFAGTLTAAAVTAVALSAAELKYNTSISLEVSSRAISAHSINTNTISAVSATFNGFAPVAKYSAFIEHTGSSNAIDYSINHPFKSFDVVSYLQIITETYGVSSARIVLADILNNGNGSSVVTIIDPNSRLYQITFIG
jgi:hypothetical protein